MAQVLFDIERPTVGLLNIGVEEVKGGEEIREAAELLRSMNLPQLEFIGFVEGDGIGRGDADVIVTEGFSGNIALKAAEGTARQISEYLRSAMVTRRPGLHAIVLKAGTLDDPGLFGTPQMAIFTEDKQAFHYIPDDLPTFEKLPPPR